jgi:hypothetical protein
VASSTPAADLRCEIDGLAVPVYARRSPPRGAHRCARSRRAALRPYPASGALDVQASAVATSAAVGRRSGSTSRQRSTTRRTRSLALGSWCRSGADPSRDLTREEPYGGNLLVRFRRGPGLGNRPGLLYRWGVEWVSGISGGHGTREQKVWAKRVERWRESGLRASEFAAELGVNAGTLAHWKYRLAAEARAEAPRSMAAEQHRVSFVEVKADAEPGGREPRAGESRFEVA